jgi:branched-chain amino acid transport system ATP-binding protein
VSGALLEWKGLLMRFGGLVAVDNFDEHIQPGELLGLIGPNGAGKTTVFNMTTGVYRPTEGDIVFKGKGSLVNNPTGSVPAASRAPSRTFDSSIT